MRVFKFGDCSIDEGAPRLQAILRRAYEQKQRPLCPCREPAIPMYIARVDGQFLIKRMPLSGREHAPSCPSYEPPYELSGLGPLIGSAIQLDEETGHVVLKLDFSLSKRGSRSSAPSPLEPPPSVRNETRKLSLRAMLHYLWDAGELTEWTSLWSGKRGWGRVRTNLLNAARQMTARGGSLSDVLFVPEVFHPEEKEAITARRTAALSVLETAQPGPRRLMLLLGEVKEFATARDGQKIAIRHMPFPLMLEDRTWGRLSQRYKDEMELWRSDESFHLIAIASFGISWAGIATVDEIALMVVNENWIPFESAHEQRLLERLSGLRGKSIKSLRFNLPRNHPIVSATLPEHRPSPVAMYIVPASADEEYEQALAKMMEARPEMIHWVWRIAAGDMPPLPSDRIGGLQYSV